jgi:phenylpyruvate tautomerase PptA (4-oxalocrotonate tautomerase family)
MPLIDIATNANPEPEVRQKLLEDALVLGERHLGRPKDVTMARLSSGDTFVFRESAGPAAYVAIRATRLPPAEARGALVAELAALLDEALGVPKSRTFVVFDEVPRDRWGVNGALLG